MSKVEMVRALVNQRLTAAAEEISKVEMVRAFVNQRLTAAAEEIFGLFERIIAEYEKELCRSKEKNERQQKLLDAVLKPEVRLHRAVLPSDVQKVIVGEEGQQEWSPSLDQEDPPEPPHIKEEQEELWTSQEGEQLQGLEEADITKFLFTPVPVKSEDDEEKPQSSQLHQRQTEQMETGADGEDCGGPEPARNSHPDPHLQPVSEDEIDNVSVADVEVSDDDREQINNLKAHVTIHQETEPGASSSTEQMETEADGEDCGGPEPARNSHPDRQLQPETEVECSECGRRFKYKKSLTLHMRSHKPFSCSVCSERFSWRKQLKRHMKFHPEEKAFRCSFCARSFTNETSMTKHMRVHSREPRFSCRFCKKGFIWHNELLKHKCPGPQSSQLHQTEQNREAEPGASSSTEQMEPAADGEDCGGPEPARNSHPDPHLQPETVKTGVICSECGRRFKNKGSLRLHMQSHKLFSCSVCSQRFFLLKHLKRHMIIHPKERQFRCRVCNEGFIWRHQRAKHMCPGSQSSQLCRKTGADGEDCGGPEPARNSHPDRQLQPETEVECSECGKRFRDRRGLTSHMRSHKPFSCSVCSERFCSRKRLKKHMIFHPEEKPFSCSFCAKRFTNETEMTYHMRVHTGEKRFSCRVCNEGFIWRHQLTIHKCPGPKSSQLHENQTEENSEKTFSFSVGGKTFNQLDDLTEHEANHTGEEILICCICEKRFTSYSQLKDHSCVSRRSSRLYQNQAEAYNLAALQASSSTEDTDGHLAFGTEIKTEDNDDYSNETRETQSSLEHESSEKGMSFSCSECGRIFSSIRYLTGHMKIHGPFICSMCGLSFARKSQLKIHKAMHRGDKGYICLVCRRECIRLNSFKKHMRTHTEENPFSCRECGERFSSRYRVRKHKLVCPQSSQLHQHQIEENKEVQSRGSSFKPDRRCNTKIHSKLGCPYCGKTFPGGPSKEHMAMHTREKRFYCNVCEQGFTFRHQVRRHKCILYQFSELYHNQTEENREEDPGASSSTEQLHSKEEVPPEQQEWSPSLDQEDPPEPPHIKEEQEELWTSQEGEQLQGLEEIDITKFLFTPVPVKSEDDEEKPQSSQLHQGQTEQMETGADGEDCGGPEPAKNLVRCSLCSKTFPTRKRLKKHMKIHPKEKLLSCAVCAKRFIRQITLKRHMVVIHTGEIRYRCRVCDQGFFWRQDLAKHNCAGPQSSQLHQRQTEQMETAADGENCGGPEPASNSHADTYLQPVSEDEIDNFSVADVEVSDDDRKDTSEPLPDELPFGCTVCLRRFTDLITLESHMRIHNTGKRVYSCRVCDQQFALGCLLKRHSRFCRQSSPVTEGETEERNQALETPSDSNLMNDNERNSVVNLSQIKNLKAHVTIHKGKRPFGCSVCHRRFTQKGGVTAHMAIHTEKRFSCSVCDQIFTWLHQLTRHKCVGPQSSQLHPTEQNREAEPGASSSTEQMETGADGEDCGGPEPARNSHPDPHLQPETEVKTEVICSECGRRFKNKRCLRLHMQSHKPLSCSVCSERFSLQKQLKRHMIIHPKERPFSCSLCGIRFTHKVSLTNHTRIHTGDMRFRCRVCNEGFIWRHQLVKHMCPGPQSSQLHENQTEENSVKTFSFSVGGKTFNELDDLTEHEANHTGEEILICCICEKRFTSYSQLKNHSCVSRRSSRLYQNQVEAYSLAALQASSSTEDTDGHLAFGTEIKTEDNDDYSNETRETQSSLEHESSEKGMSFSCSECGRIFSSIGYLKNHMKIHGPIICSMCGLRFSRKSQLKIHKAMHQGDKGYICLVCRRKFIRLNSFKNHMRTHTEENPFSCRECGERFSSIKNRTRHRRIHLFNCNVCDKRLTSRYRLTKHKLVCPQSSQLHQHQIEENKEVQSRGSSFKGDRRCNTKIHSKLGCPYCGKMFQGGPSKEHMAMHTREKRFYCNVCEQGFTFRHQLRKHKCILYQFSEPYHNQTEENIEEDPGASSSTEQLHSKEEVPPEQQEWSPSLDQEDPPEPPHIKEEQEELWTSQEGEQLQGLEEADITKFLFTPVPVKSEDDEEKPQSSQLHQRQTEQMETGADGEDCGGPEPARNSHPDF